MSTTQVVLCTCTGAADKAVVSLPPFDLVVIDEAAQATAPNAWVALLRGRRAVLVGDPQQLPPSVLSSRAAAAGLNVTLMAALVGASRGCGGDARLGSSQSREAGTSEAGVRGAGVSEARANVPKVATVPPSYQLLTTQWRMHAVVAGWSSATFYDGLVQTHPSAAARLLSDKESVKATELTRSPIIGISVAPSAQELTLKGGLERRGRGGELTNEAEVAAVVGHAATLIRSGVDPADIVVISPYTAQVALIERALANAAVRQPQLEPLQSDEGSSEEVTSLCGLGQVDVATVDSYQGREAEAVILSLVRSNARRQVGRAPPTHACLSCSVNHMQCAPQAGLPPHMPASHAA